MTIAEESAALRTELVQQLRRAGAIRSQHWQDAFASVPREVFVPEFYQWLGDEDPPRWDHISGSKAADREGWLRALYTDDAFVIAFDGSQATSSTTQPTVMARMLEALDAHPKHTALEVGTGTGYNAALLSHTLGDTNVVTTDIDESLIEPARQRLAQLEYYPLVVPGDGLVGLPDRAPYDRIIITCSTTRVPTSLLEQTRPGGIVLANIGMGVVPLRIDHNHAGIGQFSAGVLGFIEARTADGTHIPTISADQASDLIAKGTGQTRATQLVPSFDVHEFWFLHKLVHPGIAHFTIEVIDGDTYHCLVDGYTKSWARATVRDGTPTGVTQGGDRQLWTEMEHVHALWTKRGRPAHHEITLHVTPDGRHTLHLSGGS